MGLDTINELMVDIDMGHMLLDDAENDLSCAISMYCLSLIAASEVVHAHNSDFTSGMAEGFARVVMGLTGILSAYEDRSDRTADDES